MVLLQNFEGKRIFISKRIVDYSIRTNPTGPSTSDTGHPSMSKKKHEEEEEGEEKCW